MPPRRGTNGAVRGPASALTSFLAGLGVEPPNRLTTWSDASALNNAPDTPIIDPASFVADNTTEAGPSQIETDQEDERPRKRARATSIDSDDLDAEQVQASSMNIKPGPLRPVGEFMQCGECSKRFTVTAYTKEHPKQSGTYLCVQCCYTLGIDPFEKPKKPKAKPAKKEDRAKITHYDVRKGAPTLAAVCIQIIGTYIEDIDQLGDIGSINMDKVCRIISKSRKLTSTTAPLFYSSERTELAMYDCTRLDPEAYLALATLCPNLESLSLHLCGQLSTEVVTSWGKSLKALRRLSLYGPFLVRKQGWLDFFEAVGQQLTVFSITQSPRFDLDCVEAMVKHCPNLEELRLNEIGQMTDVMLQPLARLTKLRHLDITSPGSPLSDEGLTSLLEHLDLISLNLSDTGITDGILPAIAKCGQLKTLKLGSADVSEEAVAAFCRAKGGLECVDLSQSHELKGDALRALLATSGGTLQSLNIHGWRNVPEQALSEVSKCKNLKEVDIGWCREVTDFTVKEILDGCEQIELIRVWGCNQLTDSVPRRRGVKVVGIETHAI